MVPLKKLRKAIEEKSWALATEAYTDLTGESIEATPSKPAETKKKRGRPRGRAVEEAPAVLNNGKPNGFFDDLAIDPELRITVNPKLGGKPVVPRPAAKLVDVTCSICGRNEKVSPKLKPQRIGDASDGDDSVARYKCDRCICGR
jgi:hypothetical protein